ncbi:MAG: penicillin-binding transpeptidase domain-containing protein [Eubacteriales bacterium]
MIVNDKKYRIPFLILFVLIIVGVFIFRLAQLQIVEGEHYTALAENKIIQKITVTAPRGSILTQDGYEIAKNKIGYSVELSYAKTEAEEQNKMLLSLYNILEKNGEKIVDDFPILIENDQFIFTYEKDEIAWKKSNKIPQEATAEEALDILRDKYNVKVEVNNEVAIEAIERIHMNANLPIRMSEGNIVFTYKYQELAWKEENGFNEKENEYDFNAAQSFQEMRERYNISDEYSDKDARKILVFREIIKAQGFRSWQPIEIAANVSLKTVFEIDSMIHELPGIIVNAKPVRSYPYNELASHVLGYIGKVSEKDIQASDSIYKMTDLKGISGIEAAYESYLKGVDGEKFAVTDYKGRPHDDDLTNQVIDPIPGNDVHLTIDLDLQQAAEEALESQIKEIRENKKAPNAASGAVVALDVNTGGVLAMASYPDYDLNLFSTGISTEDWEKLNILVDDPLYPRPLYNNATLTAIQPGSTFKPLISIAALQEGAINEKTSIYCSGVHPLFGKKCLGVHGSETIVEGIRDSCNVFFYETGYRLGIENIGNYAKQFGLGSKTGIEIPESSGYLATKEDKKTSYMYSASNYIRNTIGIEGTAEIINDEGEKVEVYKSYAIAKELFTNIPQDEYNSYSEVFPQVSKIMAKYNVKERSHLEVLTGKVRDGQWKINDTADAAIGQGSNSFTPIQMANLIATIVNGGIHREVYLVDQVVSPEGEVIYQHEPEVLNTIDIDSKNLELVKEGMRQVAVYSSGRSGFLGFDHEDIGVGGKTGTAQYGSEDVDNTAWFECFTPFDQPEIVVVAMIIQGNKSAYSVPIARKVVDAYYSSNNSTFEETEKKSDSE